MLQEKSLEACSSWEEFVGAVLPHSSPLRQSSFRLPELVRRGVERRAVLSAEQAIKYRAQQLMRIRKLAAQEGLSEEPRWTLLQKLGNLIGHSDTNLAADARNPDGFRLLGCLPARPGWEPPRRSPVPPTDAEHQTELRRLLQEHATERASGIFRLPSHKSSELYQLLQGEAKKGFWVELSVAQAEEKLGDFLSWLFFGVEEPDKVRGCLAPERANGPDVVHLPNTVFMAGLDGYVALVKFVAECFSKAGRFPPLRGFAEDYAHGFRQLSLSSTDRRFLCAAARAPDSSVKIFVPQKLLFGPRGAPHVFCRVTDMVSAVASVLLLVPNVPHVDDMVAVEEAEAVDPARTSFLES